MYGGGRGGARGGRLGREVVPRMTGGDCSSDGAREDDEFELTDGCRLVVWSSKTWARLLVLTTEGDSLDCGSTIGARLIGCRLCDLL